MFGYRWYKIQMAAVKKKSNYLNIIPWGERDSLIPGQRRICKTIPASYSWSQIVGLTMQSCHGQWLGPSRNTNPVHVGSRAAPPEKGKMLKEANHVLRLHPSEVLMVFSSKSAHSHTCCGCLEQRESHDWLHVAKLVLHKTQCAI